MKISCKAITNTPKTKLISLLFSLTDTYNMVSLDSWICYPTNWSFYKSEVGQHFKRSYLC